MYDTILLAYDGSAEGRLALREGARLAQISGSRVILLAVVDSAVGLALAEASGGSAIQNQTEDYQAILDEGHARLTRMGLTAEALLESGEPVDRIVDVATRNYADLVVVGHHRQGAISRWLLGSVTSALNDRLPCSLLSARHEISDEALFAQADKPG